MDIKLKSIKDYPSMSEETNCFQADLWVGNKKVAHIKNQGRGGCDDVWAYDGMRPLLKEVEDFCKAMPKVECNFSGRIHYLENDLELYVGKLMDEWRKAKDFKKGIVYKDKNGVEYLQSWKGTTLTKLMKTPNGRRHVTKAVAQLKFKGATILNTNIDETLDILKRI
jgi:hypothetical protein